MSLTYGQLIDRVVKFGGEDTSSAGLAREDIGGFVNDRYKKMVARAESRRVSLSLGGTVAGQSTYALPTTAVPTSIVRCFRLRVGATPYERISEDEMEAISQGWARRQGTGGLFAEVKDAAGALSVQLYPAPDTGGIPITVRCAVQAGVMSNETNDSPQFVDEDFQSYIADGAMADVIALVDERADAAQVWEQKFNDGTELLRRRVNGRMGGPRQIKVKGYHW